MEHRYYTYRLKPTTEQRQVLEDFGSATRWLWNHFLELNKATYDSTKKFVFKHEMITALPNLKKELDWLSALPSQALQQKCMDLDVAIHNCFKRGFGFPKFKSKHHNNDSFRIPQSSGKTKHIKSTPKAICIPKLGWVNWIRHRPLIGRLKSITIKQSANHWYVSVLCEIEETPQITEAFDTDVIGIDFGLKSFLTLSTGEQIDSPKIYRKRQKDLKKRQRKLSRCSKGSNRRKKARLAVARLHRKIANIRKDFLHKTSRMIAKSSKIVGIEDLNIKGMSKNHCLAKSILDTGWTYFTNCLDYKLKEYGGLLIKIDRWYPSSKTCSVCGQVKSMPLSERIYDCDCGSSIDRDVNAGINIRNETIRQIDRIGTIRILKHVEIPLMEPIAADIGSKVFMNREKFLSELT